MTKFWLMALRPKTLGAAVAPIFVGSALSIHLTGQWIPWVAITAVLSALFIQIATNLINDALDFKKGADSSARLGPTRVVAAGYLSHDRVLNMGYGALSLAFLLGIPLVYHGGLPILVIGLLSLFFAYGYTGGPYPLAYLGLGDLFVMIFFGLIAVGGVFYLHSSELPLLVHVGGFQVGALATVLIAINNLRDRKEDLQTHKKTLAVRFGAGFVRFEIFFLLLASYLLGFFWIEKGAFWAAVLPLATAPIAFYLFRNIAKTEPSEAYNRFLAQAGLLHLTFSLLLSIGFLI
jgi:1,4-dihydroxy-2-naphthoate octaprenyltransferase